MFCVSRLESLFTFLFIYFFSATCTAHWKSDLPPKRYNLACFCVFWSLSFLLIWQAEEFPRLSEVKFKILCNLRGSKINSLELLSNLTITDDQISKFYDTQKYKENKPLVARVGTMKLVANAVILLLASAGKRVTGKRGKTCNCASAGKRVTL